jgi:hypothetical protein
MKKNVRFYVQIERFFFVLSFEVFFFPFKFECGRRDPIEDYNVQY